MFSWHEHILLLKEPLSLKLRQGRHAHVIKIAETSHNENKGKGVSYF